MIEKKEIQRDVRCLIDLNDFLINCILFDAYKGTILK